ncbi:MAG: hypothetical protein H8E89_03165 [Candidatus Nitrosopelagicus sp.]|nr:hypothetical protein [Candidatus Nitrosopelagicus sp.]
MNKIYGIIMIFAFAGLMIPTSAMQVEAASDLDYMLIIAEKGKKYIKLKINEMQNSNIPDWKNQQVVLDIYDKSAYEIEQLEKAIENGDVKSARKLFVSSMDKIKQISLMLNQIAVNKAQDDALPDYPQILKRYEMNIQKLKQMSEKLGANIDFSEVNNLIILGKQNAENGKSDQTKQVIDQISLKGLDINKHLVSINQANKIIKAQALAERYVDKINTMIVQATNSGLLDVASQLENAKIYLASSNSTSQITKNIKIIITINKNMKDTQQKLRDANFDVDEIKLSQNQKFTGKLNQLENKAKFLHSEAIGSNAALYYVEKALSIIHDTRNNLNDSEGKIISKVKLIEQLLAKAQKIVQEST